MKIIKSIAIILIVLPLLVFNACKKEVPIVEPTKTELLTGGNWTGVKTQFYKDNILVSTEIITDDEFDFQTSGKGIHYFENTVDQTFDWLFASSQTQVILEFDSSDIWVNNIETLTSTSLILVDTGTYNGVFERDEYHFGR